MRVALRKVWEALKALDVVLSVGGYLAAAISYAALNHDVIVAVAGALFASGIMAELTTILITVLAARLALALLSTIFRIVIAGLKAGLLSAHEFITSVARCLAAAGKWRMVAFRLRQRAALYDHSHISFDAYLAAHRRRATQANGFWQKLSWEYENAALAA